MKSVMLKLPVLLVLLFVNLFSDEPADQKKKWWKKFKGIQKTEVEGNQVKSEPKKFKKEVEKESVQQKEVEKESVQQKKVQKENKKEPIKLKEEAKAGVTVPKVSYQDKEKNPKTEKKFKRWGIRFDLSWLDPDIDDWSSYYEDSNVFNYGLEANYYLTPNWSLNLGINFMETDGVGILGNTQDTGTSVKYTLIPYHFGGQYEHIFKRNKVFRPYLGAGYAYAQYKQKPKGSPTVEGHEDGYYFNTGVLMNFYNWNKIKRRGDSYFENIYWVLEAERLWLKSDEANVDIGGLNYSVGLKFRF